MLLGQYLPTEQRGESQGAPLPSGSCKACKPSWSFFLSSSPCLPHVQFHLADFYRPRKPQRGSAEALRSGRSGFMSQLVTNELDGHLTNRSESQFLIYKMQLMIPSHEFDVMMEGAYAWKMPNLAPGSLLPSLSGAFPSHLPTLHL